MTGYFYVVSAHLESIILLPLPPQSWCSRQGSLLPSTNDFLIPICFVIIADICVENMHLLTYI